MHAIWLLENGSSSDFDFAYTFRSVGANALNFINASMLVLRSVLAVVDQGLVR